VTDQELRDAGLTDRQRLIWQHYDRGHSIRTIALALNLSPTTIRDHLDAATRRLHNHTKDQ
jgi:DNA-binding NarL/FixJ family response regulator